MEKTIPITPMTGWLVVKPIAESSTVPETVGGIYVPKEATVKNYGEGHVLAEYEGCENGYVGKRMAYKKYGYEEIVVSFTERYHLVPEADLIAIISE